MYISNCINCCNSLIGSVCTKAINMYQSDQSKAIKPNVQSDQCTKAIKLFVQSDQCTKAIKQNNDSDQTKAIKRNRMYQSD